MPADRSRPLKRSESAGNHYVWTSMSEPTTGSEVSFSSSTSSWSTFSAESPPPLVDAPAEFIMFPPPEKNPAPRRQPHSKKKPENHIPRPPNAFILFRSSFIKSQHVSTAVETNHSTLSKIIGMTWQSLPEDERQIWHRKAKEALDEHKIKFPKYAFKPVQTKAKGAPSEKRKVREVEPKDIKRCTKIAQLLVEGKKGHELNAAVEEFDKHHVPEIITRFEAPITAHAFRRSSSAPILDTENSRSAQSFLHHVATSTPSSSSSSSRKRRPSSTRPTRCSTPADVLTPEMSSLSGNIYPTLLSHAVPFKEEPNFSFDNFSFDNVASPPPTFDCDPLGSTFDGAFTQSLTIDTSYMDEWTSHASSPTSTCSPSSPSYMMSPSPALSAPSTPSYSGGFDAFDQELESTFAGFSAQFSLFSQVPQQQQQGGMCGGVGDMSLGTAQVMYSSYDGLSHHQHQHHHQHQAQHQTAHIELDFSAFLTPVPQYAM